jgi:uncharacterized OsmC-like protein
MTTPPAPQPRTTYHVAAHTTGGGRAQAGLGSETVTLDTAWAAPPAGLPGPAELLTAAFAACLLKNVERSSHLLSFQYRHAEVDVTARRQDDPPKFVEITYELRLDTDEPERRIDLLHRNLRRYGTVYNTLAAVCAVDGHVIGRSSGSDDSGDDEPAAHR